MVSVARCNAQYSFKTTRLKTFGSHLVWKMWTCLVFFLWLLNEMSRGGCSFVLLFAKIILVHVSINSTDITKICLFKKGHLLGEKTSSGTLLYQTKKIAANWNHLTFKLSPFSICNKIPTCHKGYNINTHTCTFCHNTELLTSIFPVHN